MLGIEDEPVTPRQWLNEKYHTRGQVLYIFALGVALGFLLSLVV